MNNTTTFCGCYPIFKNENLLVTKAAVGRYSSKQVFNNFHKIYRKVPMFKSLFNKVTGL